MKMYVYDEKECCRAHFHAGTLRLEGFEKTTNPKEADIFVIPESLMHLKNPSQIQSLPHFQGNEVRHVAFDVSDCEHTYNLPCMFIRCNTRPWMVAKDPNTISWAWPVGDLKDVAETKNEFKHDVSCHAWMSHKSRKDSAMSVQAHPGLSKDFRLHADFYGYLADGSEEQVTRMKNYKESLKHCRISLCGESIPGVFPYRFFEAMSAGRVAALVGADYVFPWMEEIPWDELCIQIHARNADRAGEAIRAFLDTHSDQQLEEMGKKARYYWLKYLNSSDWMRTMGDAVKKKMAQIGLKERS